MAGLYLDTSSLGRVLLAEPDANQIRKVLGRYDAWWSSAILVIELRRLARREYLEAAADRILTSVRLTPITDATIQRTSRLEPATCGPWTRSTSTPRSSSTAQGPSHP